MSCEFYPLFSEPTDADFEYLIENRYSARVADTTSAMRLNRLCFPQLGRYVVAKLLRDRNGDYVRRSLASGEWYLPDGSCPCAHRADAVVSNQLRVCELTIVVALSETDCVEEGGETSSLVRRLLAAIRREGRKDYAATRNSLKALLYEPHRDEEQAIDFLMRRAGLAGEATHG